MRSTDWHGAASALLLLLRRRRRRLRTRRLASRKSLVDHFPAFAHEILVKGGDVEAGGDVRHHLRHDGKQLRKKEIGARGEEVGSAPTTRARKQKNGCAGHGGVWRTQ